MEKPDVDLIEGLSPAIAIEQKATSHNPRSTVGTVTEIYDYLRLLFARVGDAPLPRARPGARGQTRQPDGRPRAGAARGHARSCCSRRSCAAARASTREVFDELRAQGFVRVRDRRRGATRSTELPKLDKQRASTTSTSVVDRLEVAARRAAAAPGGIVRDGAEARRGPAPSRATDRGRAGGEPRAPVLEQVRLPGLRLLASPSSSRGCSRSTTRWAPARAATAWARSRSSTRSAWWPSRTCRSPGGAIRGWDRRNQFYFSDAGVARAALRLRRRGAVRDAAASARRRSCSTARGEEKIAFRYPDEKGAQRREASTPSRASCPTSSGATARPTRPRCARSSPSTCNTRACPACDGTRLRVEARHVRVAGRNIDRDLRRCRSREARRLLREAASSTATKSEIAEQDRAARSPTALQFLNNVGLDYLSLDALGRHALRRRGAAHPPGEPDRLGPHRRDVRARRAVDRPAPARQRAPARDARSACATWATR